MKLHLDKILKIKTKKDLDEFNPDKPIFFENYLFDLINKTSTKQPNTKTAH